MQNLLRRRRRYMSFFGHVGASASRCLSRDEMDRVNRDWATEFADGSLAVNVQRQYGNYTVCQYIIQSGRFDEGLLHYIMGCVVRRCSPAWRMSALLINMLG